METLSVWKSFSQETNFPTFTGKLEVDVAIIGGGMTGITSAQLLSRQGLKVAVFESGKIGESNTGNSTGNLYCTLDKVLSQLTNKYDHEVIKWVIRSRRDAIDLIEKNVQEFEIDCDFKRVPWHHYSAVPEADKKIEDEFKIAQELGLDILHTNLLETPYPARKAVLVKHQAQFNPLRYIQGLARAIQNDHCFIFENSKVESIQEEKDHSVLQTQKGNITARYVIHATHTPKGFMSVQALLGPYREYGIACKVRGKQHPEGIYWGYYQESEIVSTRFYERDGEKFLIVVGEPHKVGQGDSHHHIKILENFAARHFDIEEITHRWGGQHYKPADFLPYIGPRHHGSKTFIATGMSTDGLTYGTVAAMLMTDLIQGKETPYAGIYDPARFTPIKSAPKFLKENINVFGQYVKDYFLKKDHGPLAEIAPGEGKVLIHDGEKWAVYKNENDELQVCSAICTHLGCVVHWNNAETSWDCPCHGSRFATNGEVLEGPALKALAKVELVEEEIPLSGKAVRGHVDSERVVQQNP